MSRREETPPPPPLSEAPPSYYSNESLPSPNTGHNHHPSFRNPQFDIEPNADSPSLDRNSDDYSQSNERGEGEDLPPPYSPGLRGILSTRQRSEHDVNDAPPSYYSLFGQIREAREQSSNNFTFLRRVGQIILNTVGCTILLIVFMSVPFTILVIGSIFVHECPLEPLIPIYLIVGGISGILKNIALIVENIVQRYSERLSNRIKHSKYLVYIWRVINLIFNLFMLAWTIAGGYWVYHVYSEVTITQYQECNELLYKFGFGIVTSSYILLLLTCVCACCCIGICLKVNKRRNRSDDTPSLSEGDSGHESGSEDDNESQTIGAQEDEEERYGSDHDSLYSDNQFGTTTLTADTLETSRGESFLRRFRYLDASEPIDTRVFDRTPQQVEVDDDDDSVQHNNHRSPERTIPIDNPPFDGAPQIVNHIDDPLYNRAQQRIADSLYDRGPLRMSDNAIMQYESSPYPTRHYSLQRRGSGCADIDTPRDSPDASPNYLHGRPRSVEDENLQSHSYDSKVITNRDNPLLMSRDSPLVEGTAVGSVRGNSKVHNLYITTSSEGYSVTEV